MANNDYGYVLSKSQLRSDLMGKGAYKNVLDQLGRSSLESQGEAYQAYGDTIERAYATSLRQQNQLSPNIFSGYRKEISSDIDTQLADVYQSAAEAYKKNLGTIAEQYQAGVENVYKATESEADLLDRYTQAHFDYYENYVDDIIANAGNMLPYLTKGSGQEPLTKEELMARVFDTDGKLTEYGKTILPYLENLRESDTYNWEGKTFSDWLRANYNDLYEFGRTGTTSSNYTETGAEQYAREMGFTGISDEDLAKLMPNVDFATGETKLKEPVQTEEGIYYVPYTSVEGNVGKNWGPWNNFDVIIDGEKFTLETGKPIDDETLINRLDAQIEGQTEKSPTKGDIVTIDGNAYVYAKDGKWREVVGRESEEVEEVEGARYMQLDGKSYRVVGSQWSVLEDGEYKNISGPPSDIRRGTIIKDNPNIKRTSGKDVYIKFIEKISSTKS